MLSLIHQWQTHTALQQAYKLCNLVHQVASPKWLYNGATTYNMKGIRSHPAQQSSEHSSRVNTLLKGTRHWLILWKYKSHYRCGSTSSCIQYLRIENHSLPLRHRSAALLGILLNACIGLPFIKKTLVLVLKTMIRNFKFTHSYWRPLFHGLQEPLKSKNMSLWEVVCNPNLLLN